MRRRRRASCTRRPRRPTGSSASTARSVFSFRMYKGQPGGLSLVLSGAQQLLHAVLVGLDHLLDHLAADGAGLLGGQVAVVALLQVHADLPWCPRIILIALNCMLWCLDKPDPKNNIILSYFSGVFAHVSYRIIRDALICPQTRMNQRFL